MRSTSIPSRKDLAHWMWQVFCEVYSVVGYRAIVGVLFATASQVLLFLLSVIPIQMLVVAVSGRSPLLPVVEKLALPSVESITFVQIALSCLLAVIFGIKKGLDHRLAFLEKEQVQIIQKSSGGWIKFDSQDRFIARFVGSFINAASALLFVAFAIFIIGFSFPILAAFLIFLLFIDFQFGGKAKKIDSSVDPGEGEADDGAANFYIFLVVIGGVIYLVHLNLAPSFIYILTSVILLRQGLARYTRFIFSSKRLWMSKEKLSIFFRSSNPMSIGDFDASLRFLGLYKDEDFLRKLLPLEFHASLSRSHIGWRQTGFKNLFMIEIVDYDMGYSIFIKVYKSSLKSKALHEAKLFKEEVFEDVAIEFIGIASAEGFTCLLYKVPSEWKLIDAPSPKCQQEYALGLAFMDLPEKFIESYRQEYQLLGERLSQFNLPSLYMLVNESDRASIGNFESLEKEIFDSLNRLPLVIFQPRFNPNFLLRNNSNEYFSLHWPVWTLEPLGAGFFKKYNNLVRLRESLSCTLSEQQNGAKKIELFDFCTAAIIYELESALGEARYSDAIAHIKLIGEHFNANDLPINDSDGLLLSESGQVHL